MEKLKTTIKISKIEHRGEFRIKVVMEKRADLIAKIKSIKGRRWSKTKNCWHAPYDKVSFIALEKVFGKENLHFEEKEKSKEKKIPNNHNKKGELIPQILEYLYHGEIRKRFVGNKILIQQLNKKWIKIYVPQDKKGWTAVIKNIVGRKWNVEKIYWEIPNVKSSFHTIKNLIGLENVILDLDINKDIPDEYISPGTLNKKKENIKITGFEMLNESQKKAIQQTEEQIILQRLSHYTLKSYKSYLIAVFLFHKNIHPEQMTNQHVQDFLLHQIKFKKISESTQSSIINSVKAYWEKVLKRPKSTIVIPRPKKPKHLPNVFSQAEVVKLIESPKNIKHKLILLLIYSAGLRLSELVNLKVRDINHARRVIFIKDGKGKKDRFVTLAEVVIPYLKKYQEQYRPNYWLIEGQSGGQYSKRSVQNVFKKALENSKVFAYGTVHTLRHSYATHCVENGFSVALLQEALGHGSIKTTEKYLHISSVALKKLISPLDIIKDKEKNKGE